MLLALAMSAATTHAGIPARFGGTPDVVNEDTPHYDLKLFYHDGTAQGPAAAVCPCIEHLTVTKGGR